MVTVERRRLVEQRDQALTDLLAIDEQVAAGELPAPVAERLRGRYEQAAAQAITALEAGEPATADPADPPPGHQRRRPQRQRRSQTIAYLLAGVAVFAVLGLLPTFLQPRPPGGWVSGNEAARIAPAMPGPASPAVPAVPPVPTGTGSSAAPAVPLSELESAVAARPDDLILRLALALRYQGVGRADLAAQQYAEVLRRDPGNAEAHAHLGWLLLQAGQPRQALTMVDRALTADPTLLDALWFKANIELYGLNDPAAALTVLAGLQRRGDLGAALRGQVSTLTALARQRRAGGPR